MNRRTTTLTRRLTPTTSPLSTGLLQRKCACGQRTIGGGQCEECQKKRSPLQRRSVNQAEPSEVPPIVHEVLRSPFLKTQPKLKIGQSNDKYEQEAEQIAAQVMRLPLPGVTEPNTKHRQLPAQEIHSSYERELKRGSTFQAKETASAPALIPTMPSQSQFLPESGKSLPTSVRNFFEPRFNQDFSHIRIHTDTKAAESALALNAKAYTIGNHIVFGKDQYAPSDRIGQQLIAHELVHTLQQKSSRLQVQRYVSCRPARMSLEECPAPESGELTRSRREPMVFGSVSGLERGALVWNFAVGSSSVKPDLASNAYWTDFLRQLRSNPDVQLELLAFTDCHGDEHINRSLRIERAQSIFNALPTDIKGQVSGVNAAGLNDCMTDNTTESDRAQNRSVFLRHSGTNITFEEEEIEGEVPDFVCGPDVTAEIADAISRTRTTFSGWTDTEKEESCDDLDSLDSGECAWDIVELHNNAWIHRNYRPTCATVGATPPCGSTVQVGDQCYYAGSANYVIFGTMCKLCSDYFISTLNISGINRFTKRSMLNLIDLYKGTGFSGLSTPASNFVPSNQWAVAGYDGWPSGGALPPGDRSNCEPLCPLPYTGPPFRVNWSPHQFFTGQCGR